MWEAGCRTLGMAWSIVTNESERFLAFVYTDRSAGPSAKGVRLLGDRPAVEDASAAALSPKATVRLSHGTAIEPLPAAEREALRLPPEPEWMRHFGGVGAWRQDARLAGQLLPGSVDDLRARFYIPAARTMEWLMVRLTAVRPEVGGYEGTLLGTAKSDPTLAAGLRVTVRPSPGAAEPVWLSPAMAQNLEEWEARCSSCGFDLLLEPVTTLLRRQFPATPTGPVMEAFTTRCAACGQTQLVQRKGMPPELAGGLQLTAAVPPPRRRWRMTVVVGGAVLLAGLCFAAWRAIGG